jgi:hypothetical protein
MTLRHSIRAALEWLDHKFVRGETPELEMENYREYGIDEDEGFFANDESSDA